MNEINIIQNLSFQTFFLTLLSVSMAFASHGYGPHISCRNTTNTVTAEVCVPAFTEKITEITLAVKEVQDNDYCYEQIRTVCEITETINQHELCTYSYAPKTDILPAQVTQVSNLYSFLKTHSIQIFDLFCKSYNTNEFGAFYITRM